MATYEELAKQAAGAAKSPTTTQATVFALLSIAEAIDAQTQALRDNTDAINRIYDGREGFGR